MIFIEHVTNDSLPHSPSSARVYAWAGSWANAGRSASAACVRVYAWAGACPALVNFACTVIKKFRACFDLWGVYGARSVNIYIYIIYPPEKIFINFGGIAFGGFLNG
jgi:hypothetical protein